MPRFSLQLVERARERRSKIEKERRERVRGRESKREQEREKRAPDCSPWSLIKVSQSRKAIEERERERRENVHVKI